GGGTATMPRGAIDSATGKGSPTVTVNNAVRPLLRRDAAVRIRPMGLLGDKYLELLPGTPKEPALPDGAVLTGQAEPDITGVADSATATLVSVSPRLQVL